MTTKRVTIKDIAREAHVSIGTVSKILNGQANVKDANRRAIVEAIEKLDYRANEVARSLAHKPLKLGVIFPAIYQEFFQPIWDGVYDGLSKLRDYKTSAEFAYYDFFSDDAKILGHLEYFENQKVNGIILAPSFTKNYGQVTERLQSLDIPVVLILTDLPGTKRIASVGVDTRMSGTFAADLAQLDMQENDTAVLFIGNKDMLEHKQKAEYFQEHCDEIGVKVSGVYETQDDTQLSYFLTRTVIRSTPSLRAIYAATGNAEAVCHGICDCGKENSIKVIATDVYPGLKEYVERNIIIGAIDQQMPEQGYEAVSTLYNFLRTGQNDTDIINIKPQLLLKGAILDRMRKETV